MSALGLGALHALEPGHGKGVMGAYLAVSGARLSDALIMGVSSAATHTLVVVVLAFILDGAAGAVSTGAGVPGEQFEGFMKLISGVLIVLIGFIMFSRARRRTACACCRHEAPVRAGGRGSALLVGISNGIMPCPGALAVLLMSLSAGKIASGIWLVLAFGVGGAAALTMVGILFVKASFLLKKLPGGGAGRGLALASACLVLTIGFVTLVNGIHSL
jgi:ABC-type nickel/cobalt efflux system permease component RcnA